MSRVPCEVPFCGRTTAGDPERQCWICGDHWKLAPARGRRALRRLQRKGERERATMMWHRIKRQVIEAAAGIG